MGARKGTRNGGGRQKGTPNKTTAATKEVITNLLTEYSNSGQMSMDFNCLEPKDRLTIAEKLAQYVMPKIQSVAVDLEGGIKKVTIEQELIQLSQN